MGRDGSGQITSGRLVSSRPESSRGRAWVCGYVCVCVCTREEDLVRLAQNRESRIAIDLGVWGLSCLFCLCRLGPNSRRPGRLWWEGADGWTNKTAGKQATKRPKLSRLCSSFPSPFLHCFPWSLIFGRGCRDVLLDIRPATRPTVECQCQLLLPRARDPRPLPAELTSRAELQQSF